LTIWDVHIDGKLYNAFDEPLESTHLIMASYFNLGVDAEIGSSNHLFKFE
jgi:hypothetical protein